MISYEDAVKIGKEAKPNADYVVEYENGYVFHSSQDGGYGGLGRTCVVVLKKDGRVVQMMAFVNSGTGKEIGRKELR